MWTSILTLHADKSYAVLSWLAKFKPKILYQWRDATAGPLVLSADESLNQSNNQSANPCRDTSSELNFAVGQSAVSLGKNKLSVSRKSRLFYQNTWCIGLEPKLCVPERAGLNAELSKYICIKACCLCSLYFIQECRPEWSVVFAWSKGVYWSWWCTRPKCHRTCDIWWGSLCLREGTFALTFSH